VAVAVAEPVIADVSLTFTCTATKTATNTGSNTINGFGHDHGFEVFS